jgi:hypothetical protein
MKNFILYVLVPIVLVAGMLLLLNAEGCLK